MLRMAMTHGFEKAWVREIPELRTRAELFRHSKTGAEMLSLVNDDENKVFGITFRTPPSDSTGVAHILEHSVLCGSRKFPVKEPFVELLKSSLKTFLNAMTYPDKTCYPVASQNAKDLYNLIDVYLDAVLYPRLNPFIFQQEGWHFEAEEAKGPLVYKGVVFSEMKGAYSSPENLLAELSQQSLFPDTPYGFDSGGNPDEIPRLTFDRFKAFHETYYHPSNARIYFYGDDDPEERLRIMNEYLKDFEYEKIDSAIILQRRLDQPKSITRAFASGGNGEYGGKGMLTLNWLLEETLDPELNLAFHMLEHILLGMPGSPLRKALIDSKLGEDLAGQGLGSDIREMYFSTGLKGMDPGNADRVEALILDTLSSLVAKGIDPHTIEAAQNTLEFALRENNTGVYPRGLALMLRGLITWLYDGDPLGLIAFEGPLESLKKKISRNRNLFEEMVDRYFLKNLHRTRVLLRPDPGMAKKQEESEKRRLAGIRAAMNPSELDQVLATAVRLKEIQTAPDSPEALATVPTLKLSDLSRLNKTIPFLQLKEKDAEILYHDLFTSGIAYLDLGFNLHALPQRYLPYVPLFGRALLEMGTEKEDFVALTHRISRKTGGIRPVLLASSIKGSGLATAWLHLRGKAMMRQTEDLLAILRDVILTLRLDNKERFRQMVLEAKSRLEQNLVPSGHQFVDLRLRARHSEADWVGERLKGISQLFFIRALSKAVEEDWPRVLAELEEMRQILMNRNALLFNITVDEKGWARFHPQVSEFLEALPSTPLKTARWKPERPAGSEGMIIPAQVNYVGKAASLYAEGYRFHGSCHVISRYLRNTWLWEKVRVQGGAYGAFALFDRLSGVMTLVSYRDPNLMKTLDLFDGCPGFLRKLSLNEDELARSLIGTIGDIDQYQLPDAKGYTSMVRYLAGETDEDRQRMREEVLGTKASDFTAFGEVLEEALKKGLIKVLGPESSLMKASAGRPGWLKISKVL
jgi:Zn-dependent M16 (insulinase) family peptidase